MIWFFDSAGTAVWHASWQAAVLAVAIVVIVRSFGERLAPKWRYLLWSVVLVRLLFLTTPASPWSVFNFVWNNANIRSRDSVQIVNDERSWVQPDEEFANRPITEVETSQPNTPLTPDYRPSGDPLPRADTIAETTAVAAVVPTVSDEAIAASMAVPDWRPGWSRVLRIVVAVWLAGVLWCGAQLLSASVMLRRRLTACRPVSDVTALELLNRACRAFGVKRRPSLFVTPEAISPCLVGIWMPKIVLPESILTSPSTTWLRHVLAHELAHLVRGDLWTNWLLLVARTLHWFNPIAWWSIREMQAEREAACDELALVTLGEAERTAYANTLIDFAAKFPPAVVAPAMIGLISSVCRLQRRIKRVASMPTVSTLRAPIAAGLLIAVALFGLTDAMPQVVPAAVGDQPAPSKSVTAVAAQNEQVKPYTIRGRCIDHIDQSPLPGISVRLYVVQGRTAPPVVLSVTLSNAKGEFEFPNLVPPRREERIDRLAYGVIAVSEQRPVGTGFQRDPEGPEWVVRLSREKSTLTGRVINDQGKPVAGAAVYNNWIEGRPLPGVLAAITNADGHFEIDGIPTYRGGDGKAFDTSYSVIHPDYPEASGRVAVQPDAVTIKLQTGCIVSGTVIDRVTGQPASAIINAERIDEYDAKAMFSDETGRFRFPLVEGRYNFYADSRDRVCVAILDRECLAGGKVELPPFELISGGFIAGRVINTATGKAVTVSDSGSPITIGLYGPSRPKGRVTAPTPEVTVDASGRFKIRAVPGENYPYFVNTRGNRMSWDTREVAPPIEVKEGQTTSFDMTITPPIPPAEKLVAAQAFLKRLPASRTERVAVIIKEFRNLKSGDETEFWCTLMQELVTIGKDAVPQLCEELDRTTQNRMLRLLGFALRTIGDPRAVPALIRAIPRTLLPSSSDYGLLVGDADLMELMQQHDLDAGKGGAYFGFGRPEREIMGALRKLTGQNFNDSELFGIGFSDDPRRQVLQRQLFQRHALKWQKWWEAYGRELTNDAAYQKVNLKIVNEPLPPPTTKLGPGAILSGGMTSAVISPAIQGGEHATFFHDCDTGFEPKWPAHIPKDEAKCDQKQLDVWAAENGLDLMCVTHRASDGTETFVLRALGMKAWELNQRDLRNIDKTVAAGKLPEGREVGELLMHFDAASQQYVPNANAAFLFVSREGTMGIIETTDRVTRTEDITGYGSAPAGVGFHKGVRFNLKLIKP